MRARRLCAGSRGLVRSSLGFALMGAALGSPPAHANGQTTHIWISRQAIELLPEGELKDLLRVPANEAALVHGTMFPDGGYPIGHPYAEAAHWEPFQERYHAWIREHHPPPFTDEAERHVAFIMGLGSHGMADQHFDACYLTWSQNVYDSDAGWAEGKSMDEATDFVWAHLTGAQEVPPRFLPEDPLIGLYADHGIEVDAATFDEGHDLLELAVQLVGIGGQDPDLIAQYTDDFPWAATHMHDLSVPGVPAYEAEQVALYWQELWDRLHGLTPPQGVLRAWPVDGAAGHPRTAALPESRLALFFAEGVDAASLSGRVRVRDAAGATLPTEAWLYYGDGTHILLVRPLEDWPVDAELAVEVAAGVRSRTGVLMDAPFTSAFSTRAAEPEPRLTAARDGEPNVPPTGCGDGGAALLLALPLIWPRRRRT